MAYSCWHRPRTTLLMNQRCAPRGGPLMFASVLSLNPQIGLLVDLRRVDGLLGGSIRFRGMGDLLAPGPALPCWFPSGLGRRRAEDQAATWIELVGVRTLCHSLFHAIACGQWAGNRSVGRPCGRTNRAGTLTSSRRRVAPRATAKVL